MEGAGYGMKGGLARLAGDLEGLMDKPPTVGSIRVCCLSTKGRGYKKPETIAALCLALKCREVDLFDTQKANPAAPAHVSTWDWIRAGVNVADRESWPI